MKWVYIIFLLIAFIGIGVATSGYLSISQEHRNEDGFYLDESLIVYGKTYNLISVSINSYDKNFYNVSIKEFGNKYEPSVYGTLTFLRKENGYNIYNFDYNITELSKRICVLTNECLPEPDIIKPVIMDVNIVMADEFYTKSKVPIIGVNYCKLIMDTNIYNKTTHYAYKQVNGKFVLDAEYRWLVLEGCEKQKLAELCTLKKFSWCP